MKSDIEERAIELAEYIIETKATVRAAAKKFGVSKSTVHMAVTKRNGLCGLSCNHSLDYIVLLQNFLPANPHMTESESTIYRYFTHRPATSDGY